MFKSMMLAMVPMLLMATISVADDDLLSEVGKLKAESISDAEIAIESDLLGDLDLDGLAQKAGGEKTDEAIEACFRRFGYRSSCWYGHGYGYGCYRPCYTYYQSFYCYRPVYYYTCYPVYHHYWGCY